MARPNIQIDDEVREMTEEEYERYLLIVASIPIIEGKNETPTAD
jgi:hypothetical protein